MAINNKSTSKKPTAPADKAPAWLNIQITDKNGKVHNIGGMPIDLSRKIHKEIFDGGQELIDRLREGERISLQLNVLDNDLDGESVLF